MRNYKTEGIIIKRINYGEADRILTVFTKHHGKLKVLAKGVRKINSRRGPNVELFNQVILFLHKGKVWDIVTEAKTVNSFKDLRKDLRLVSLAYQAAELVDKLTREGEKQKEVFTLLSDYLNDIYHLSLQKFKVKLLGILGFLPRDKRFELGDIDSYIESIIEEKLVSKTILRYYPPSSRLRRTGEITKLRED